MEIDQRSDGAQEALLQAIHLQMRIAQTFGREANRHVMDRFRDLPRENGPTGTQPRTRRERRAQWREDRGKFAGVGRASWWSDATPAKIADASSAIQRHRGNSLRARLAGWLMNLRYRQRTGVNLDQTVQVFGPQSPHHAVGNQVMAQGFAGLAPRTQEEQRGLEELRHELERMSREIDYLRERLGLPPLGAEEREWNEADKEGEASRPGAGEESGREESVESFGVEGGPEAASEEEREESVESSEAVVEEQRESPEGAREDAAGRPGAGEESGREESVESFGVEGGPEAASEEEREESVESSEAVVEEQRESPEGAREDAAGRPGAEEDREAGGPGEDEPAAAGAGGDPAQERPQVGPGTSAGQEEAREDAPSTAADPGREQPEAAAAPATTDSRNLLTRTTGAARPGASSGPQEPAPARGGRGSHLDRGPGQDNGRGGR